MYEIKYTYIHAHLHIYIYIYVYKKIWYTGFVSDYGVILDNTDRNILDKTADPTMVNCTYNYSTSRTDVWQCPCNSVGRYIYFHFRNPTNQTALCECEVVALQTPCSSTSCEYWSIWDVIILMSYFRVIMQLSMSVIFEVHDWYVYKYMRLIVICSFEYALIQ